MNGAERSTSCSQHACGEASMAELRATAIRAAVVILGDDDAATEAVQRVELRVTLQGEKERDIASLRSYMLGAARNEARSMLRSARRRARVEAEYSRMFPECEMEMDHAIEAEQRHAWLVSQIRSLPPRCGEVVRLMIDGELPHSEIASRLGISVRAVEKQVNRARRLLRAAAKQNGMG